MASSEVNLDEFNNMPTKQQREYLLNIIDPKGKDRLAYIKLPLQDLLAEALSAGRNIELLTKPNRTRLQ